MLIIEIAVAGKIKIEKQGSQGLILKDRGDLDGAMALHKEQERICREPGIPQSLVYSLTNQAILLNDELDRPREALPLAEEAYQTSKNHNYVNEEEWVKGILERIRSRL